MEKWRKNYIFQIVHIVTLRVANTVFCNIIIVLYTYVLSQENGSKGPHWTLDQVKQLMAQKKIQKSPAEFWAALNMIYSDYVKVAKKHGVGGNIDFYIDMALAFLNDKDANPNKLACYYKNVVKH